MEAPLSWRQQPRPVFVMNWKLRSSCLVSTIFFYFPVLTRVANLRSRPCLLLVINRPTRQWYAVKTLFVSYGHVSMRGRQLLYLMRPRWKFGRQACNRQRRRIGLALIGKFSRTALFGLLYPLGLRANEWTIIAIFPLCIIHNTIYRCGVIQSAAAASFEGKQQRRKKTIQLIFAAGVHKKKKKNP